LSCRGRLARWTLRGVLLVGGVFGFWGLREAVVDDPAQAVEPARSCIVGDLLNADGAASGGSLLCAPHPPSRSADEDKRARIDLVVVRVDQRRASVELSVRVPTGEWASSRRVPARHAVGASRAPGVDAVVETAASVARPVVSVPSPVVEEIPETGLLEPVGTVVRPVVEPIVEVLPSTLAPVLGLVQPIIGPPAAPSTPPADAVDVAPAPADGTAGVGTSAAIARPVPPSLGVSPQDPSPARASDTAGQQKRSAKAVERTHVPWPGDPVRSPRSAPGAPASTAGSGSAAVVAGIPADGSLPSWAPDLERVGCYVSGCDKLAGRSPQPDTRPA
jgi:hypothetical protein